MSKLEDNNSAFAQENLLPVILIQVSRLYDVMMVLLRMVNPEDMEQLYELHEAGQFLMTRPAFRENQDEE